MVYEYAVAFDDKCTGAIVVVMQRVHVGDLTGFLLAQSKEWDVLSLPAIAEADEVIPVWGGRTYHRASGEALSPEREPIDVLNALKLQIGGDAFFAQYQQMPTPPGGAMIKRKWVRRYSAPPRPEDTLQILQSWDTAMKGGPANDWSVCTTWAQTYDGWMFLLDVWRDRVDYPTLKASVIALSEQWRPMIVLVEEAGTAVGLIDELRYQCLGVVGVKPERDKIARMAVASAKFEAGNVYLPEQAPWLADLEAELFAFPGSRHTTSAIPSARSSTTNASNSSLHLSKHGGRRDTGSSSGASVQGPGLRRLRSIGLNQVRSRAHTHWRRGPHRSLEIDLTEASRFPHRRCSAPGDGPNGPPRLSASKPTLWSSVNWRGISRVSGVKVLNRWYRRL